MVFAVGDRWVWDSWFVDDGTTFHMYYLNAPKALGDPELRHRHASIGHATSADLYRWEDHGVVIEPGAHEGADRSASWTGSVVRGPGGTWTMTYTGSAFVHAESAANIETIVAATSRDLHHWTPSEPTFAVDSRWYESLEDRTWHEEAWRDPWVYCDDVRDEWRMLLTARSRSGTDLRDRGVVGAARSADLGSWEALPPITTAGAGFAHLEVPQPIRGIGRSLLVFSCDADHLAGKRAGGRGGVWAAPMVDDASAVDLDDAVLIAEDIYAGRVVEDREGGLQLLGFEQSGVAGFGGRISDPRPFPPL